MSKQIFWKKIENQTVYEKEAENTDLHSVLESQNSTTPIDIILSRVILCFKSRCHMIEKKRESFYSMFSGINHNLQASLITAVNFVQKHSV